MPREVMDSDGITWTCIQAFAGLGQDAEKEALLRAIHERLAEETPGAQDSGR